MAIKNLSQLKKALAAGAMFRIEKHHLHPEMSGQIRVPNIVQTNGLYTHEYDKPDSPVSTANYGRGYWLSYGKAADWDFSGNTIKLNQRGRPVFEITVLSAL